jgi:hypothetical protein
LVLGPPGDREVVVVPSRATLAEGELPAHAEASNEQPITAANITPALCPYAGYEIRVLHRPVVIDPVLLAAR